jgi:flagellar biosynthesis GTPase FlhF
MDSKPSLYDILGVPQSADNAQISRAFAEKLDELDRLEPALDASALASRKQKIRIAASTLFDPATRLAYDAKLNHGQENLSLTNGSLSPEFAANYAMNQTLPASSAVDSVNLRAEALALRAEALSLRADAMLLQAGSNAGIAIGNNGERSSAWLNFITSAALLRTLAFLIFMSAVAFGLSRCAVVAPLQANSAANQAAEKAALQEYFQTHGVRPANMAELELLETERRRKENALRSEKQDVDKAKRDEREFEEESRRRAQEVSERLRIEEEESKRAQKIELQEQERLRKERNERRDAERVAEEERQRKLEEKWRQIIVR